jgi:hypothetical protein
VFGNFNSKHIFLTEEEAEEAKCQLSTTNLAQKTKSTS